MILTGIKEKILEVPGKIRAAVSKFRLAWPGLSFFKQINMSSLAEKFTSSLGNLGPQKKRLVILASGCTVVFFAIILIISLSAKSRSIDSGNFGSISSNIPHGELFYPDEPDFVPHFLLEREPRQSWTLEDIRPYWSRPENPDFWRGEIYSAIDLLMEGVP